MAACQNGAGAKKGRKKLYECQVQFVQNQGHQALPYQCCVEQQKKDFSHYINVFIHLMQKDIMPRHSDI